MILLNKVLTSSDRTFFGPMIELMWDKCPDVMSRKIEQANVQQAFVLFTVTSFLNSEERLQKLLSVGCFEDTAYETLLRLGHEVTGVDPAINQDLHSFAKNSQNKYDIAFATSVIEHVPDDNEFLQDMIDCLKEGGIGILTMDFKDDYKVGDSLPNTDLRFYTKSDLTGRFKEILSRNFCNLVGPANWDDKDNFFYQGHTYSFATLVFRKGINRNVQ